MMTNLKGWQRRANKAADYFESTWMGLFIVSAFTMVKGVFYLPFMIRGAELPAVERWGHPTVWAVLWIGVGAVCMIAALCRRGGPAAVAMLFMLYLAWAAMYGFSWIFGPYGRGYVTGHTYLHVATLTAWAFSRSPRPALEVRAMQDREEGGTA